MRLLLKLLLVVAILLVPVVGGYFATPQLAAWLAARYAPELGLSEIALVIDRPGLDGLRIRSANLAGSGYKVTLAEASLTYSWSSLRAGRLEVFNIRELTMMLDAGTVATAGGNESSSADVAALFALAPFDSASIEALRLEVPAVGFVGEGRMDLADRVLRLALTGLAPAEARGISLDASLAASGEIAASLVGGGAAAEPFVTLRSRVPTDSLELAADVALSGFALELITTIADLPRGTGSVGASFAVSHPWPPDGGLDLQALSIGGPFSVSWNSADGAVRADSVAGRLALSEGRLEMDLDGRLGFERDDLVLTAHPSRIRAGLEERKLSLETRLWAEAEQGRVEGTASASLHLAEDQPARSEVTFDGSLHALDQAFPLDLEASVEASAEVIQGQAILSSGLIDRLPVSFRYRPDDQWLEAELTHRLRFAEPLLAALWPPGSELYDLDAGTVTVAATMKGRLTDEPLVSADLALADVTAHYEDTVVGGLAGEMSLVLDDDELRLAPSVLTAGLVDPGAPIRNVETTLEGSLERLRFSRTSGELLGGRMVIGPFEYELEDGRADLEVALVDLDLGEILALEGKHIAGDGRIDGNLPVKIRNGEVSVSDGRIAAREPGGSIRLSTGIAGALTQPGLDLALGALTNFRFDVLEAAVDYSEAGDLLLGIRLEGRNPEVEGGRPIHYNLNVSENIPVLLRSLRLQDAFTERIEKEVLR